MASQQGGGRVQRRGGAAGLSRSTKGDPAWAALHARMDELLAMTEMTSYKFGVQAGASKSSVSRYFNRKPEGEVRLCPWDFMDKLMAAAENVTGRVLGEDYRLETLSLHQAVASLDPRRQHVVQLPGLTGQAGNLHGVNHSGASRVLQPRQSAYRLQVRQIAPPALLDRDAELAELAEFCVQEERGPYVWWRAEAWAGKSALLSTFVDKPPEALAAARVRLVSFFITAPLASQDTREAFMAALSDQLCALLGLDPLFDQTEMALLGLLHQAANGCQQEGGRLVLVVDGLDEDRGVTTGPYARSIAALLPGCPPPGMRVIVSGRPNPPIPDDVPTGHPLRDPGIVRPLSDSAHAKGFKEASKSELKRLLKGCPLEQDLLGLLTTARGGLSGPDLRELTGADLVEVEDILHAAAGRTFTRRRSSWAPADGEEVYLLGHEELHNAAVRYLAPRLAHYRDRLHTWAESYRTPVNGPPWPEHTPEYLLSGYPRMLAAIGDTARLITLAIDPARHDRMLDLIGGDTVALTEISTCQNLLLDHAQLDLYALARVSHHRCQLTNRNTHIPTQLPAVWAALGQPNRAEALALAITDPYQRVEALAAVAKTVARNGDHEHARTLAIDAEQITCTLINLDRREAPLQSVARVLAKAGDCERAEWIALNRLDGIGQGSTLAAVAEAMVVAGDCERARALASHAGRIACTLAKPTHRVSLMTKVAEAMVVAGDCERARALATDAEQITRTQISGLDQAEALVEIAEVLVAFDDCERARALVAAAEEIILAVTDSDDFDDDYVFADMAMVELTRVSVVVGDCERAIRIARSIFDEFDQAKALVVVAGVLAAGDDRDRACALAAEAEQIARSKAELELGLCYFLYEIVDLIILPLTSVAEAMVVAGDRERARALATYAEQMARTELKSYEQIRALAGVAEALVAVGDCERARALATEVEHVIRNPTDPDEQVDALVTVARMLVEAGDCERARALGVHADQVALTLTDPHEKSLALISVARVLTIAGGLERAVQIARTLLDEFNQVRALIGVAETLVAVGDCERALALATEAEQITRTLIDGPDRPAKISRTSAVISAPDVLVRVSRVLVMAGDRERAPTLAAYAEEIARTLTDGSPTYLRLLVAAAVILAVAGDLERAERIARTPNKDSDQAKVLIAVAEVLVEVDDCERARTLAADAEQIAHILLDRVAKDAKAIRFDEFSSVPRILAEVMRVLVAVGDYECARELGTHAAHTVPAIIGPDEQLKFLVTVVKVVVEAGNCEQARDLAAHAEQIVLTHIPQHRQIEALADVAELLVVAGDCEHAEQIARTFTDPVQKSRVLVKVAETVTLPQARRLLAEAFALGPWLAPLLALAKILPQEAIRIVDAIYADEL